MTDARNGIPKPSGFFLAGMAYILRNDPISFCPNDKQFCRIHQGCEDLMSRVCSSGGPDTPGLIEDWACVGQDGIRQQGFQFIDIAQGQETFLEPDK